MNPYEKNLLALEEKLILTDIKTKYIKPDSECHTNSTIDKEDELAMLERFIWFSAIAACFCIVTLCANAIYPGL